jgi:ribonuclease T2
MNLKILINIFIASCIFSFLIPTMYLELNIKNTIIADEYQEYGQYQQYEQQMKLATDQSNSPWDYFLFVQLWPPSWINNNNIYHNNYSDYNNTYFTVHGLWPEFLNGTWPQFCNATKFNITSLNPIKSELEMFWTDFHNPEHFWSHEYYKHMSCLEEDPIFKNELNCFEYGLTLRNMFNYYDALKLQNIIPTNNCCYKTQVIHDVIKKYVKHEPVIICNSNGVLNEIIVCIDKFSNLIDCPESEISKQCTKEFIMYSTINI